MDVTDITPLLELRDKLLASFSPPAAPVGSTETTTEQRHRVTDPVPGLIRELADTARRARPVAAAKIDFRQSLAASVVLGAAVPLAPIHERVVELTEENPAAAAPAQPSPPKKKAKQAKTPPPKKKPKP